MASNNQKSKLPTIKAIIDAIVALDKVIEDEKKSLKILNNEYPQEKLERQKYEKYKYRQMRIHQIFEENWTSVLNSLDYFCSKIRNIQPNLMRIKKKDFNSSVLFPNALAFGRIHLSYKDWQGYIPRLIPFPLNKALRISDNPVDQLIIQQLFLRMIFSLPFASLEITVIDPLRLGKSLNPFLPLLPLKYLFSQQGILTRADEIEKSLKQHLDYVEDVLQTKFQGNIKSWSEYNSICNNNALKYKVLFIFSIPEQMTDRSLWYLERLLENGPLCGVLPVLTINKDNIEDKKFKGFRQNIIKNSYLITKILSQDLKKEQISNLSVAEEPEIWPDDSALSEIIEWIGNEYGRLGVIEHKIEELWDPCAQWKIQSIEGIEIPIGWTEEGAKIKLSLGGVDTEHHVLIAGRSGSGKSNLLHVIIHSLCHYYSPKEVKIFLLDYKQGTEFNIYTNPPLPHLALVSTVSEPEYGVTVLKYLVKELNSRSKEFKKYSVTDVKEYKVVTGITLPRIVLIIDEFQQLFSEGRHVSDGADKLLSQLLRQGRAYGIHIILSTQTLKGIQSLALSQIISQIGCRLALACTEEDSVMILGSANCEAVLLRKPYEGILNNANGVKSANQKFLLAFAERNECAIHQNTISKYGIETGCSPCLKVFDGSKLPNLPSNDIINKALSCFAKNGILLGEEINYEADYFIVPLLYRAFSNILVAGHNKVIHDGLLTSIIMSIRNNDSIKQVIYFNAQGDNSLLIENNKSAESLDKFLIKDKTWDGDLAQLLTETGEGTTLIIIDGLDSAKMYHSGLNVFKQTKKEEPLTPQESLKRVLEEGPQKGILTIAFADNWKRCNTVCKDLLNYFELRIGYLLNDDDAGLFSTGTIAKLSGLDSPNKAIFSDRLTNQIMWFRPFISYKENENLQ